MLQRCEIEMHARDEGVAGVVAWREVPACQELFDVEQGHIDDVSRVMEKSRCVGVGRLRLHFEVICHLLRLEKNTIKSSGWRDVCRDGVV